MFHSYTQIPYSIHSNKKKPEATHLQQNSICNMAERNSDIGMPLFSPLYSTYHPGTVMYGPGPFTNYTNQGVVSSGLQTQHPGSQRTKRRRTDSRARKTGSGDNRNIAEQHSLVNSRIQNHEYSNNNRWAKIPRNVWNLILSDDLLQLDDLISLLYVSRFFREITLEFLKVLFGSYNVNGTFERLSPSQKQHLDDEFKSRYGIPKRRKATKKTFDISKGFDVIYTEFATKNNFIDDLVLHKGSMSMKNGLVSSSRIKLLRLVNRSVLEHASPYTLLTAVANKEPSLRLVSTLSLYNPLPGVFLPHLLAAMPYLTKLSLFYGQSLRLVTEEKMEQSRRNNTLKHNNVGTAWSSSKIYDNMFGHQFDNSNLDQQTDIEPLQFFSMAYSKELDPLRNPEYVPEPWLGSRALPRLSEIPYTFHLASLTHLTLARNSGHYEPLSDKLLISLLQGCSSTLKYLDIREWVLTNHRNMYETTFYASLESLVNLESLIFIDMVNLKLEYLFRGCENLEFLKFLVLGGNTTYTPISFDNKLQLDDFYFNKVGKSKGIKLWSSDVSAEDDEEHRLATELCFDRFLRNVTTDPDNHKYVIRVLRRLQKLYLWKSVTLQTGTVMQLLPYCTKLRELELIMCCLDPDEEIGDEDQEVGDEKFAFKDAVRLGIESLSVLDFFTTCKDLARLRFRFYGYEVSSGHIQRIGHSGFIKTSKTLQFEVNNDANSIGNAARLITEEMRSKQPYVFTVRSPAFRSKEIFHRVVNSELGTWIAGRDRLGFWISPRRDWNPFLKIVTYPENDDVEFLASFSRD